jgi:hypothetical protein
MRFSEMTMLPRLRSHATMKEGGGIGTGDGFWRTTDAWKKNAVVDPLTVKIVSPPGSSTWPEYPPELALIVYSPGLSEIKMLLVRVESTVTLVLLEILANESFHFARVGNVRLPM